MAIPCCRHIHRVADKPRPECQRQCQPKCFVGLSAAQDRAESERLAGLVFVSIDVNAGVFHSQSRRSQRFLGLWVLVHAGVFPRRSFHDDDLARTILTVGALAATIVATMCVEWLHTAGILAVWRALVSLWGCRGWSCAFLQTFARRGAIRRPSTCSNSAVWIRLSSESAPERKESFPLFVPSSWVSLAHGGDRCRSLCIMTQMCFAAEVHLDFVKVFREYAISRSR